MSMTGYDAWLESPYTAAACENCDDEGCRFCDKEMAHDYLSTDPRI